MVVSGISGKDVPDLLCSYRGAWYVAEVKTGKAKLRPGQQAWHRAQRAPVAVLRTPEEAESWVRSLPPTEAAISRARALAVDSYPVPRPGDTGDAWADEWERELRELVAGKDLTAGPA